MKNRILASVLAILFVCSASHLSANEIAEGSIFSINKTPNPLGLIASQSRANDLTSPLDDFETADLKPHTITFDGWDLPLSHPTLNLTDLKPHTAIPQFSDLNLGSIRTLLDLAG